MIREHNFSGVFYPRNYANLSNEIELLFDKLSTSAKYTGFLQMVREYIQHNKILTLLIPHGSLKYCGYVSTFAYLLLRHFEFDTIVILSSDHRGTSPGISTCDYEYWTTPLGKVRTNQQIISDLISRTDDRFINNDPFSFEIDHTIEPQLPFVQSARSSDDFDFVPILQKNQDKISSIKLAKLLKDVIPKERRVVLLCTSNLTHYLNYEECGNADRLIISEILKLNVNSFYDVLEKYSRLVCGYGCIATAMEFSRLIGNSDAILLKHSNSGEIDGNRSSVVGYSSILMF